MLGWEVSDELPLEATMWALMQKPDVMLYELAPWTYYPLDGTDGLSQVVDEATMTNQVTNVCPTGDQGSAHKHAPRPR